MCVALLTNPATSEGRQTGEHSVPALSYGIDLVDYKRKGEKDSNPSSKLYSV